jgi:hypothetical protein
VRTRGEERRSISKKPEQQEPLHRFLLSQLFHRSSTFHDYEKYMSTIAGRLLNNHGAVAQKAWPGRSKLQGARPHRNATGLSEGGKCNYGKFERDIRRQKRRSPPFCLIQRKSETGFKPMCEILITLRNVLLLLSLSMSDRMVRRISYTYRYSGVLYPVACVIRFSIAPNATKKHKYRA